MRLMASMIDQTADLYDAMPKQIPSIQVEDPALPFHQEESRFPDPNRITAKSGGVPQQETVRRLTEAGLDYYNNGKLEEAAECYRKALELRADNKVALYTLGVISGQLKRYEESKAAFERLLRLLENRGSVDPTLLAAAHQGIGAALLSLWCATGPRLKLRATVNSNSGEPSPWIRGTLKPGLAWVSPFTSWNDLTMRKRRSEKRSRWTLTARLPRSGFVGCLKISLKSACSN